MTASLVLQGTAQNTGGAGTDTFVNFENLTGSAFNDTLTGDDGANILTGGNGNDLLDLTEGVGAADQIRYSQTGLTNVDSVIAFDVAGSDAVGYTIGTIAEGATNVTLSTGNGTDIAAAVAAGAVNVVDIAQNADVANNAAAHAVKFTTGASTFQLAIGTGSFAIAYASFAATEAMIGVWFDTDTNEAVFGTLLDTAGGVGELNTLDTFAEATRVAMSAADFANVNANDIFLFA